MEQRRFKRESVEKRREGKDKRWINVATIDYRAHGTCLDHWRRIESHAAPVLNGRPRVKTSVCLIFLCSRKGCNLVAAVDFD